MPKMSESELRTEQYQENSYEDKDLKNNRHFVRIFLVKDIYIGIHEKHLIDCSLESIGSILFHSLFSNMYKKITK